MMYLFLIETAIDFFFTADYDVDDCGRYGIMQNSFEDLLTDNHFYDEEAI